MSRRTIFRCDVCAIEVEDYEPDGWRRPYFQVMSPRGRQLMESKKNSDLCSSACLMAWLEVNVIEELKKEEL